MSKPIIEIEKLGKKYRIGAERERYLCLRDSIVRKSRHIFNILLRKEHIQPKKADFWALRDISFNVNKGEAIGIIGRNGAGKSTLLKILSQITPPTEGRITMRGRIASLLEVGTGFHPELSGRENIYLNGAILGMTRKEIRRKFDEIVAFAEVEKFLDTPVKRYSSGMYVRLAFSVAAHLEPEILVVDEVLSVGDALFQEKCLGKMNDISSGGRTVLFVSHNMAAVQTLCSKAILLDSGHLIDQGPASDIVSNYLSARGDLGLAERYWINNSTLVVEGIQLMSVRVCNFLGIATPDVQIDQPITIEVSFSVLQTGCQLGITLILTDSKGMIVLSSLSNHGAFPLIELENGQHMYSCNIPPNLLNTGRYSIGIFLWTNGYKVLARELDVITFLINESENSRGDYLGDWVGVVRPRLKWTLSQETLSKGNLHD